MFRYRFLSQIYPECILTVGREVEKRSVYYVQLADNITIFDDEDLRRSCARCRTFDHLQQQAIKTLANRNRIMDSRLVNLIADAFEPNEWYDPAWAEILGKKTVYYRFKNNYKDDENDKDYEDKNYQVVPEDINKVPVGIRPAIKIIRQKLVEEGSELAF